MVMTITEVAMMAMIKKMMCLSVGGNDISMCYVQVMEEITSVCAMF